MVNICIKFRKNIKQFQSYAADMISILIITKGHNSMNIVHGVTVLVLFTTSNHCLHFTKCLENIFLRYGAGSILILLQRSIIP